MLSCFATLIVVPVPLVQLAYAPKGFLPLLASGLKRYANMLGLKFAYYEL